jgi:type VII secretion-associated serine protease mycosin
VSAGRSRRTGLPVALALAATLIPLVAPPAVDADARDDGTALAAAGRRAAGCDLPPTQMVTAEPWPSKRLAFRWVWPLTRGRGVLVAVVDSGVDGGHPMLSGHVLPGVDIVNGGGRADTDCVGHGTFVAGIIASRDFDGIGFSGVAPDATILPVRQADAATEGTVGTLAASIRAAVDARARVINVSVTAPTPTDLLASAVRYAADHDVVIVAAAGNDAQEGNARRYPAAYPGVIAVGAVGSDGKISSFSETDTGVSLVAPGVDVVGPGAGGDGLVVGGQGTSFAAPFVTGTVALVRAYRPELTAAQVKHRLEVTADRPAARALPDPAYGFGIVNPYRAVTAEIPGEAGMPAMAQAGRLPAAAVAGAAGDPARRRGLLLTAGLLAAALLIILIACAGAAGRRRVPTSPGVRTEPESAGGG